MTAAVAYCLLGPRSLSARKGGDESWGHSLQVHVVTNLNYCWALGLVSCVGDVVLLMLLLLLQENLNKVLVFNKLEPALQRKVVSEMYERTVSAGEILIKEGDSGAAASELYVVKTGKFEVSGRGGGTATAAVSCAVYTGQSWADASVLHGSGAGCCATAGRD